MREINDLVQLRHSLIDFYELFTNVPFYVDPEISEEDDANNRRTDTYYEQVDGWIENVHKRLKVAYGNLGACYTHQLTDSIVLSLQFIENSLDAFANDSLPRLRDIAKEQDIGKYVGSIKQNCEVLDNNPDIRNFASHTNSANKPYSVNEDLCQITMSGEVHETTSEAARMACLLSNTPGEWVSMSKSGFSKPSQVKSKLPPPLLKMIESSSGKGYRLRISK